MIDSSHIYYRDGVRYQLVVAFHVHTQIRPSAPIRAPFILLRKSGLMTLFPGFAWDGGTWALDTKTFMRATAAHDALYELMRLALLDAAIYRPLADVLMRELAIQDGMCELRAWWIYNTVRAAAASAARPPDRAVYCAPSHPQLYPMPV